MSTRTTVTRAVAEMVAPAARPRLRFGIVTGYAAALGFGLLAAAATATHLLPWRWAFVYLVLAKAATNSAAWAGLARDRWVLGTQAVNTVADVVILTAAIYYTGGAYSPLLATYVIVIAVLSLLSNLVVTVLMAVLIVICFATMLVLTALGWLAAMPVPGHPGAAPSLAYTITAIAYCALVVGVPAFFSSGTLRLLRRREADLETRTAQLIASATQRSQFMASMTHELRTPIHGVQGLADVIAAGVYGPVTDKQRDACTSIKRSAQTLLQLVDDVLQLARAEAGKIDARPGQVDVAQLVERVAASVSWMVGTKRLALDVVIEGDLPPVRTDERWLSHVLVNLLANAVKFTPEGGRVTVRAQPRGDMVVLAVEDTGIGIAPEERAAIFEPFRQIDRGDARGYGGVGLGLALVAQLTDLLAATVEVDSAPGKGSTFRVLVPLQWHGRTTGVLQLPTHLDDAS